MMEILINMLKDVDNIRKRWYDTTSKKLKLQLTII